MEKKNDRDIVFAIFLIFIGGIFLLNTTGIVGWGIWNYLIRFWPVFLIFAGIRLVFKKTLLSEIIVGVIAAILFTGIGLFSYMSYTNRDCPILSKMFCNESRMIIFPGGEQIEETEIVSPEDFEESTSIETRNIDLKIGASRFTLTDDSTSENYLEVESKYTENAIEPSLTKEIKDNALELSFKTTGYSGFFIGSRIEPTTFDLLTGQTDLPTSLITDLGAGEGTITLNELLLNEISSKIGAGKMEITLEGQSVPESMTLDIGAGEMILNIPENVGFKMDYDLGIGEITLNGKAIDEFIGDNPSYFSPNYEDAEIKIEIDANVGVGSLQINNI
jgi:hypothetical protein